MKQTWFKNHTMSISSKTLHTQIKLILVAIILVIINVIALIVYFAKNSNEPTIETQNNISTSTPVSYQAPQVHPPFKPLPVQKDKVPFKINTQNSWQTIRIKQGDTLSTIFADLGLDQQTLEDIKNLKKNAWNRMHAGQKISFKIDDDHQLQSMEFKVNTHENLIVKLVGKRYKAFLEQIVPEKKYRHLKLNIRNSLYQTAHISHIPDKIVFQLINTFNWDIDFTRDIHSGDEIEILYENYFIDKEPAGVGNLLYAKIKNSGKKHEAVQYTDPKGHSAYYTLEGKGLRKAFLKTPVKYGHISSYFNLNRMHPILHLLRAHKGVDYAAPRGTPVKSAGDGIITFTGYKNGYGNTIIIKHSNIYETLYAHLDHFAQNIHAGKTISQEDIIGYVGNTGLATGPHLHYEFHINGVHHDPLSAKLPHSLALERKYRYDFAKSTRKILAQLKDPSSKSK